MPLTVRLNPKTERALNALARRRGLSRSDVVRDALEQYHAREHGDTPDLSPYDAWQDVIGVVSLGVRDPKRTTGDQLRDILHNQARARRTR